MSALWYGMRATLRSLVREIVRGVWARWWIYPQLAANERDPAALRLSVARRARRLGLALDAAGGVALATPLIDKTFVRAEPARFVRPRRFGTLVRATIHTSGTSGTPLAIVQSLSCIIREEAFVHRQLHWIGYRHGQRRAWLRGDIVCATRPKRPVWWCRDWFGKMLLMSSYHLSDATIGAYVGALERFDPVVLHAYPSSVAALAAWLNGRGRQYRGRALRGVMTSSETVAPAVRAQIEQAFGVPVYDWYGQAERVAAIGTCEHGRYHLLSDYGIAEVLDDGELVGTSLNNAAMPLARYRTGDTVALGRQPCPCGRVFPVVDSIAGRAEQVIVLPDGRRIGRLDRVFQGQQAALVEGQVVYQGNGHFMLRVVRANGATPFDDAALLAAFRLRVPDVDVHVEHVDAIARGPNGKFAFVVTELAPFAPPAAAAAPAPVRVLMFGTSLDGRGGIAATVAGWRAAGWFARDGVRYVPTHVEGAAGAKLAVFLRAVATLLRARPAIVHVHAASDASFFRKALLLAIARARGCRTVFHLHGGGFQAFAVRHRALVRHTLAHSSAVLALSDSWAAYLRTLAPGAPVTVLPNAVALPPLTGDGVDAGRILFLGRLEASKGLHELLAAVALLVPRYPNLRLVLAGSGPMVVPRAEHIVLPGWIDDARRAEELRRAAIFCLPSHAEGLPLALLEAMAAGKAIVATSVGAIPEALASGAGLLVPPRDVPALAAALATLLDAPQLVADLGRRARAIVAARYDTAVVGAGLAALYRQLEAP
jgi:phenylacetate-CoA ligase